MLGMATLKQKIEAEASGRKMLADGGLPQPDDVEYGHTCIRFLWNDQKVALIIEIDEPPEDFETVGEYIETLEDVREFGDLVDLCHVRELQDLDEVEVPVDPGEANDRDDEAA